MAGISPTDRRKLFSTGGIAIVSVIVLGSINIDLVTRMPRLPVAGETLQGSAFFTNPGGKGANQAVAAARLGVATYMVGRVGRDRFGTELLDSLQAAHVCTDRVSIDEAAHTGVATIAVDDKGENQIAIVAGANGRVNETDVGRLQGLLPHATALLMQLEIPLPTVEAAAKAARQYGIPVILDPAPASAHLSSELYGAIDIITPNEVEAAQLSGFRVDSPETAMQAAAMLRQKGVGTAIIKLGSRGVVCATAAETFFIPAFPIDAIDTVAAGDAFNGAMAAAMTIGLPLKQAIVWGMAAGALCATKPGAQAAMPDRDTLQAFLEDRGMALVD